MLICLSFFCVFIIVQSIDSIPDDAICIIARFLQNNDLARLSRCNHNTSSILREETGRRAEEFLTNHLNDISKKLLSPIIFDHDEPILVPVTRTPILALVGLHASLINNNIYYIKLFELDRTMSFDLFLRIRTDYARNEILPIIDHLLNTTNIGNNWRDWMYNHKKNNKSIDLRSKLYQITHSCQYIEIEHKWNAMKVSFKYHPKLLLLWNDLIFVIKKDILKIIMSKTQNDYQSKYSINVRFEYNEQWLFIVEYLNGIFGAIPVQLWKQIFQFIKKINHLYDDIKRKYKDTTMHKKYNITIIRQHLVANFELYSTSLIQHVIRIGELIQSVANTSLFQLSVNDTHMPLISEIRVYSDRIVAVCAIRKALLAGLGIDHEYCNKKNVTFDSMIAFEQLKAFLMDPFSNLTQT